MSELFRGIGLSGSSGPTLRSVRKMSNLKAALREISRRPGGIDGIPYEAFGDPIGYLRWNPNLLNAYPELNPLKTLQESLVDGYIPDASQAIRVRKRDLERGTVANRIIERGLTRKLNFNLDRHFKDSSFGYRPGRSAEMAILRVREAIRDAAHWALKTDLKDFFASIDLSILGNQLRETIADESLCEILLSAVSPAVVTNRVTLLRQSGLPAGNGISPFLSNLFLNKFDEACSQLLYYRYADDLLVLCRTRQEAEAALRFIRRLAGALGLQLNPDKTFVRDLYRQSVVFLGYEL